MRQKRGRVKRKPMRATNVISNEPHVNMGYQEAEYTALLDFDKPEFESRMDTQKQRVDSSLSDQQVGLAKQVVNAGMENNVNSSPDANIAFSGNLAQRSGRTSGNTSMSFFGSSSVNPNHNGPPMQGERTHQELKLPHQDPRYIEEELQAALLVIKIIMRSDAAQPFNVPVDPIALGIPDYFDVIDTPMDFVTIRKNLENGVKYANSEDVFKDVRLIWENCSKYNKKGNYILELMKRVKSNFIKFWGEAKLFLEQPQTISEYSNLRSPTSSNARQNRRDECPVDSDTNNSVRQPQNQMGPSQLQSMRALPIYTRHGKHGQECPVGRDTDNTTHQLQDQISPWEVQPHRALSSIYSQRDQIPNASSTWCSGRGQGFPVGPDTDNLANELQDKMNHTQELTLPFLQEPDTSSGPSEASLQRTEANNGIGSIIKKRNARARGPTRCLKLWNTDGKRIYVTINELGQPVGLEARKLTSFLGTVARDGLMAPLIYADWRAIPEENKEKMWQQVELTFDINPKCKDWVMKSLCNKWRDWKSKLKTAHYNIHVTDEERLADRDERVLPDQWTALVSYWSSAEGEAVSAQNKANRAQQKLNHTIGEQQDQTGPSQVQSPRRSSIYSQNNQPPNASNVKRGKRGLLCPMGLDTDNTASPVSPDTDIFANQLQDQMSPSQVQVPSSNTPRHQPQRSCNQPQAYLQQPDTSSNQPRASLQEPDTSSGQSQASLRQTEANKDIASIGKQKRSRSRGPTRCLRLWNKEFKRIFVNTNELGEPLGPEAPKLSSFLGTVARDGHMAPLIYADWRDMPDANKEKMWQQVELTFDIDSKCKDWVLKSLGIKWRDWKSKLKTARYYPHATDEERLADRDERVLPDQWATLVAYWSSAEGEAVSAQNRVNRANLKFYHTAGAKSFARVREEERAKRPDGKEPTQSELFVLTRTRKDGRPVNEESAAVISQLLEHTTTNDGQTNQDDILSEIMGKDRRRGRMPTYGSGPSSPSNLMGSVPTLAEALRMVSAANSEVCEMKERMVAMEQTCTQMATQMSTMMVMMSSMQRSPDNHQSNFVANTPDTCEEGVPQQQVQVRASTSRRPVSTRETRSSKRSKVQNAGTTTKDA